MPRNTDTLQSMPLPLGIPKSAISIYLKDKVMKLRILGSEKNNNAEINITLFEPTICVI